MCCVLFVCVQGFVVVLLLHKSLTVADTRKRRIFFDVLKDTWFSVLPPHSICYV